MIIPEKTYTSNPFVDNVIYYAKYLAMNCTIKDEDEALENETIDSLKAGDLLISCVEGHATYYSFENIPKEILEKYIPVESNLDLFVNHPEILKIYLGEIDGLYKRDEIIYAISKIARETYIDHYVIMTEYLDSISKDLNGVSWLDAYKPLYNSCISKTANCMTKELFDILPDYTRERIIKKYLNNYDDRDLKNIIKKHSAFMSYYNERSDTTQKNIEMDNISQAMRSVFISHYDMMVERGYVKNARDTWLQSQYIDNKHVFSLCKRGTATYLDLYKVIPIEVLQEVFERYISTEDINDYKLLEDVSNLTVYFSNTETIVQRQLIEKDLQEKYLANYQPYLDFSIVGACNEGTIGWFTLIHYIPKETQKMILNTQIEEYTNLKVYSKNKKMLDSYLATLPPYRQKEIIDNITKDMIVWYPLHHNETNNYYRSLAGLPPIGNNGKIYEDTLIHSYDEETGKFKEFGTQFIEKLPTGLYPEVHWKQNIYEFNAYDIGILEQYGVLDEYLTACGGTYSSPRYRYLRYLADNKLDIYRCRRAYKFDLIGIPVIDDKDATKRFVDCYMNNRDYIIRTVYSEAHKFQSDYYDKFMIIFTIINTIMDMLSSITEMIIDREVFDARCIKWLFESFGVPYYSEIPIKYLRAMLKNLNLLLKYKSSTKNMIDICRLFGFNDVRVFGYYLFKDRLLDAATGEYVFDEDNDIGYNEEDLWVQDPSGGTIVGTDNMRYSQLSTYRNKSDYDFKTVLIENDDGTRNYKHYIANDQNLYIREELVDANEWITIRNTYVYTTIYGDSHKQIIGTIPTNTKISCRSVQEEWYQITDIENNHDSQFINGYIQRQFIIDDSNKSQYPSEDLNGYIIISSKQARVYTDMSSYELAGTLSQDTIISCAKISNNWYKILAVTDPYVDYNADYVNCYIEENATRNGEVIKQIKLHHIITQMKLQGKIAYDFIPLKDTTYFKVIKANQKPAELKFIKVPVDEMLGEYKNNDEYIISYDEIVYADEGDTWDGGRVHEDLEQELLDHDFNAVKAKYISVETITDLTEQSFQVTYFYNMLFDNLYSEEALTLKIPYIKSNHVFKFMDIVCYLFALMYYYNGIKDKIMYSPTQILYVKGYNFDNVLNELLDDPKCFAPQEEHRANRDDIFDINTRIAEDNYNYREQFNGYDIKSFNLEADIDALDKWLWDHCQMHLDDFIVDDGLINFDHIITLRHFYSLNNSYYQTDIFKDAIAPIQYNQELKSAYGIMLYKKVFCEDFNGIMHAIVYEDDYKMEVINDIDGSIFIINYDKYIVMADGTTYSIYYQYKLNKSTNTYRKVINQYYYYDKNKNAYKRLFDNMYFIIDEDGQYIFSTDNIYKKDDDGNYVLITDEKYFLPDANEDGRKRIIFGKWWIKNENGEWVLDPDQAYVYVVINGTGRYIPYREALEHDNVTIPVDELFIKHDNDDWNGGGGDGHFIKFSETDYYRRNPELQSGENVNYLYDEVELYVEVQYPTDEQDIDPNGVIHYYKKLSAYLSETNWVWTDDLYIYDPNTNTYINEKDLLSPNNCYFEVRPGVCDLVINNLATYEIYPASYDFKGTIRILVLNSNNDYNKYIQRDDNFVEIIDEDRWYVYDSDEDYIIVLIRSETYENTKQLIVVFNKNISESNDNEYNPPIKYNPEITDEIWDIDKNEYIENWDENDWFYKDKSVLTKYIGMNGENIWYYKKPGADIRNSAIGYSTLPVGSGFYLEASAYLGDFEMVKGDKYYISFDIETNFTGKMQICNTADDSIDPNSVTDKIYDVIRMEKQHIFQVFTANSQKRPSILFLIYDFANYPIHRGDYVIVSNIRVVKANSDGFISQDIPSYDKLQEIYRTNEAIYKWLAKAMREESDFYRYKVLKKIYDALMISKYNKEAFKIKENTYAKTYTEFLENRDAVLYSRLTRFMSLDPDAMHKEIADEIVEVTYALDDCVDTYSYGFLNSYFPAVSASYIQQYITKLINWFKSWKEHLLGVNTIYKLADPNENLIKILEKKQYKNKYEYLKHNVYVHDTVKINPIDDKNIIGIPYRTLYGDIDTQFQMYAYKDIKFTALDDYGARYAQLFTPDNLYTDIYTQKASDYYRPNDRVRLISRTGNRIEYNDPANNLKLIFNNDEIIAKSENGTNLKITTSDSGISKNTEFNSINENNLNMTTDETADLEFISQYIDEINLHSGDHIDWRNLNNE